MKTELTNISQNLEDTRKEKEEVVKKYETLEKELEKVGHDHEKNMDSISKQMDWGKCKFCRVNHRDFK